jgi:cation diffusion facilitator CzcD-associated flavoprotein CzcO
MFHSARWDHSVSLPDKRIGLIGTGSTGGQITAELGGNVKELRIFQRTPQWVLPMPNLRYSRLTRAVMQRWPRFDRVGYRFWQWFIEHGLGRRGTASCWRRLSRAISTSVPPDVTAATARPRVIRPTQVDHCWQVRRYVRATELVSNNE